MAISTAADDQGADAAGDHVADQALTALGAARRQRAGLRDALVGLEATVAAPMPGRVAAWGQAVHDALATLTAAFERHLAVTEGADGLFSQILSSSPRLDRSVAAVREEHRAIGAQLAEVTAAARTLDPVSHAAADLREAALGLLAAFVRHRQHGSDLVYAAYATDIGGSE
jgi:hypothetical protein